MSFTAAELQQLALSDAAETGRDRVRRTRGCKVGRPRTAPDTPEQRRNRERALASYYRRKAARSA